MSRIGKQPVVIPDGVTVTVDGNTITVKGKKAELVRTFPVDAVEITVADNEVVVKPKSDTKLSLSLWGTLRALVQNMVTGVVDGFEKKLEVVGVGYKLNMAGKNLKMSLGYSHDVTVEPPEGITISVEDMVITVAGADKDLVGQVAAKIKSKRPVEPYKGKGIKLQGEYVRRKQGKAAAGAKE
jgi:large subunit ribosomal protein L6